MKKPPNRSAGDAVHAVVKSIVGAVPYGGSALSVLMETVFAPPIERRRETWFKELADVTTELQQKVEGLTAENLSKNELFISVAAQATQIALRNHREEKLEALRNAVFRAGLPNGPDEQVQMMYLRFIDELTPGHLAVLALFDNPVCWMNKHNVQDPGWGMGGPSIVIERCLPELRGQRELYEQIVRDLQARGLMHQGQFLNVTMSGQGLVHSRTTDLGKRFIAHISRE